MAASWIARHRELVTWIVKVVEPPSTALRADRDAGMICKFNQYGSLVDRSSRVLGLGPKPAPGLDVRPPFNWRQDSKRQLRQALALTDDRAPVTGAKDVAAEPDRIADELAVRWVWEG